MANSHIHALSSQRRFGGLYEDHVAVHDWFDRSKEAYGHFRHRGVRHSDYGIDLACRIFGTKWSDQGVLRQVCERHVIEDLGHIPTLASWVSCIQGTRPFMIRRCVSAEIHAQEDCRRWGGVPADYLPIHHFLDEPEKWLADPMARAIHHHSFGCFTAELALGPLLTPKGKKPIPTRWVTEAHVIRECGMLPSLQDWMSAMRTAPWMNRVPWKPTSGESAIEEHEHVFQP